ncbi:MAG: hypothetical protein NT129_06540 [Candidatus Aenigmarchaeota archaeon]|nr:hypothetical protein [Candidatus Aenigmarchaeota archaeon]
MEEEKKGIEFDEKGMIIWPEGVRKFKEKQRLEEELMKTFTKKIKIHYLGTEHDEFTTCTFEIKVPEGMSGKEIIIIRNWTNKNVKLKPSARAWIERINPNEEPPRYFLKISGRGNDERCTWCRSFRTALRTRMIEQKCAVIQEGRCEFD